MQGGGLREESVGLLSIIEPLHMLKDGGWDSARGPSKHFQACYYFILGSQALVSKANQSKPLVLLTVTCTD